MANGCLKRSPEHFRSLKWSKYSSYEEKEAMGVTFLEGGTSPEEHFRLE